MTKSFATVFSGGTLVTMDRQRRIVEGDLRIEHGRIVAIGPDLDRSDAEVVDATGLHLLPGFVQGHTHLGQALFRGLAEDRELLPWLRERVWPLEAAHDDRSAYWSGMLGAADCLLAGTTTIQDIGLVHHMDSIYQAIADSGLRAVAGPCLMDQGEGVPARMRQSVGALAQELCASHQRWHGAAQGRISGLLCPRFILSCSTELWELVVGLAGDLGVGVHTHLLEHPDEATEVVKVLGVEQFEYLDGLGVLDTPLSIAHGVQFTQAHGERLAGRALGVIHCPSANLKLGSGIADLVGLAATPGVKLGIGCDGAPCNNDMDILEEMRLAGLLQGLRAGPGRFCAERALALATCDGADAIGIAGQVGSLEVGKAADLVLLDLERPQSFADKSVDVYVRVVYATARDAVRQVWVDGVPRVLEGRLVDYDGRDVVERARAAVAALLARASLG